MTATTTKSIATQVGACCQDDKVYVAINAHHEAFPNAYVIRIYGNGSQGQGPVGIWQLLTDDEVAELGVGIYRFTGGGLVLEKGHRTYFTAHALAVAVWRLIGKPGMPKVSYL